MGYGYDPHSFGDDRSSDSSRPSGYGGNGSYGRSDSFRSSGYDSSGSYGGYGNQSYGYNAYGCDGRWDPSGNQTGYSQGRGYGSSYARNEGDERSYGSSYDSQSAPYRDSGGPRSDYSSFRDQGRSSWRGYGGSSDGVNGNSEYGDRSRGYSNNDNSRGYNGRGYSVRDASGGQENYGFKRERADHNGGFNDRDTRRYGGGNDRSNRDARSYVCGNDRANRYGGDFDSHGGRKGGGGYGGGNWGEDKVGREPAVGEIEGSGYENIGDTIMDPRLQELWTGRAAPLEIKADDPDLQNETKICRRPGFGKDGRTLKVNVNYFGISLDAAPVEIFKYHVDFVRSPFPDENLQPREYTKSQPPRMERPLPRAVVRNVINAALRQYEHELHGARVVHDGMSALFSPRKLEWNAKDFLDVNPDGPSLAPSGDTRRSHRGPRTFIVKMKLVETIAVSSLQGHFNNPNENVMPVLQALDVVSRHLGAQRLIAVGRNFFAMKKTHELKGGKELCWGYHQAIRVAENKVLMNVDQAATVFYEPCELMKLVLAALDVRSPTGVCGLSERFTKWRSFQRIERIASVRFSVLVPIELTGPWSISRAR